MSFFFKEHIKLNTITIVKISLIGLFCVYYVMLSLDLKSVYEDIRTIQSLSSNTSRFISLSIASNMVDDEVRTLINEEIQSCLDVYNNDSLFILNDESYLYIASEMMYSWEIVEAELDNVFNDYENVGELNYVNLLLARENYNKNSISLLLSAVNYSKDLNEYIRVCNYMVLGLLFFLYSKSSSEALVMAYENHFNLHKNDGYEVFNDYPKPKQKKNKKADIINIGEYKEHYSVTPSCVFNKKNNTSEIHEITQEINENAKIITEQKNLFKAKTNIKRLAIFLTVIVVGLFVSKIF